MDSVHLRSPLPEISHSEKGRIFWITVYSERYQQQKLRLLSNCFCVSFTDDFCLSGFDAVPLFKRASQFIRLLTDWNLAAPQC